MSLLQELAQCEQFLTQCAWLIMIHSSLFISDRVPMYASVDRRVPTSGNPPGVLSTVKATSASREPRHLPMGVVRPEGR